jgi:hypothetical protein
MATLAFPVFLFFLCVDYLRYQHTPTNLLGWLIIMDILVVLMPVWGVQVLWRTLRILSFLELVWSILRAVGRGVKMYMQNL